MNKLSSFIFFVLVTTAAFGQSVYDCSLLNPLVSQSDIENSGTEFFKQCVLFDGIYNFDQADEHTVTAQENIHLKAGFHSGSYDPNGYMHLKLDEQPPVYDVTILNYPDLNGILRYKKMEFGIDVQGELLERITKFIDPAYVTVYDALNPFLDWELDVNVKFTHPATGTVKWRDGFFYQDYTVSGNDWVPTSTNPYPMRIRFAPPENGYWLAEVSITYATDQTNTTYQTIELPPFAFNVIESGHPGYVKLHYNKRNLQRGGDLIFPMGHVFPGPYNRVGGGKSPWGVSPAMTHKNVNPADWNEYISDIADYIDQGGKYIKTTQASYENLIEFEVLGNYYNRLHYAWEQDKIMNICEESDVLMDFNLLFQDVIMGYGQNGAGVIWPWGPGYHPEPWDYGPYDPYGNVNPADNYPTYCYYQAGTLPSNMFLDPALMYYHKQRTRYYVARFGYSPQIYTWELMSEPFWMDAFKDSTGINNKPALQPAHPGHQTAISAINTYHDQISQYIKVALNDNDHLITMSFAPVPIDDHYKNVVTSAQGVYVDIIGINQYALEPHKLVTKKSGNNNGKKNLERQNDDIEISEYKYIWSLWDLYDKPIILSEVGHANADVVTKKECLGITGNIIDVMTYGFSGIAGMHPWSGYAYGDNCEYDERLNWPSTIFAEQHMNSYKVTQTLHHRSGNWKQGRQIQEVYGSNDREPKELQYYLSESNHYACGYVRNRSYNVHTMQIANFCPSVSCSSLLVLDGFESPLDNFYPFDWQQGPNNLYVYGLEKKTYYTIRWYEFITGNFLISQTYKTDNQYRLKLQYPDLTLENALRPILWFSIEKFESGRIAEDESSNTEEHGKVSWETEIEIWPNPVECDLSIYSAAADVVKIYDLNGICVLQLEISPGENIVSTEKISAGVYILKFDYQGVTTKIIKL